MHTLIIIDSHGLLSIASCCRLICGVGYGPHGSASGYTPASYITYSEDEKHFCAHEAKVVVDAPASVCFGLWDDWHRIVDYMDLVAQVRGNTRSSRCFKLLSAYCPGNHT